MESYQDWLSAKKNHAGKRNLATKLSKKDSEVSTRKLIIFFFLAIIPALLLGYLLIYGAHEMASTQKKNRELSIYHQQNTPDYWQYQKKNKQVIADEEQRKKNLLSSLHRMSQETEVQREALRLQQEQLELEQQRIRILLQEFKKNKP